MRRTSFVVLTTLMLGAAECVSTLSGGRIEAQAGTSGDPSGSRKIGERKSPPTLEVLDRFIVPPLLTLSDVRWAGASSVYLADMHEGVSEVRLAKDLPKIREVAPPARGLKLPLLDRIAVTDRWIVISSGGKLAWKKLDSETWTEKLVLGDFHDFDIKGDNLVILGWPPGEKYRSEKINGAIVWQTDLNSTLDDWDPLYESKDAAALAEAHGGLAGADLTPGSIRFLKREGYFVHPSFVPGLYQLSATGAPKRQWDEGDLWDKASLRSKELQATQLGDVQMQLKNLDGVLKGGNAIEVVLALPEGPGIIVREPKNKRAVYRLAVLGAEIRWYDVPQLRISPMAQIRGDVDAKGRVVLAGITRAPQSDARVSESEVVVLRMPE